MSVLTAPTKTPAKKNDKKSRPPKNGRVKTANAAPVSNAVPAPLPPVSVTISLSGEVADALQAEAEKIGMPFADAALDALHRGLREMRQDPLAKLAYFESMGLVPKKRLTPGKTLKDVLDETPWPHDELDATDEEYQRALERD